MTRSGYFAEDIPGLDRNLPAKRAEELSKDMDRLGFVISEDTVMDNIVDEHMELPKDRFGNPPLPS